MSTSPDRNVVTFGCRLNAFESEAIGELVDQSGRDDLIVVNTCAVTAEAERQARQTIRKLRRDNPDKEILVTGCAAQIDPERFAEMDEVDLILGNDEKLRTESYDFGVSSTLRVNVNDIMSVKETAGHLVEGMDGRTRAFVEIQLTRGRERGKAARSWSSYVGEVIAGVWKDLFGDLGLSKRRLEDAQRFTFAVLSGIAAETMLFPDVDYSARHFDILEETLLRLLEQGG